MENMNFISTIASAMFLFSSAPAMAGSPYNLTMPATGLTFKPRVVRPARLRFKPRLVRPVPETKSVIIRPVRIIPPSFPYTAMAKSRARRQGVVFVGGARWNCTGNRCTTNAVWTRPTVQTCQALARSVGAIQSYGKRGAGLNAGEIRLCNAGIVVTRSGRKPRLVFNRGLGARTPVLAPRLPGIPTGAASRGFRALPAPVMPRVRSGFAPVFPTGFVNRGKTKGNHLKIWPGGSFVARATGRLVPGMPLPGRGGFASALRGFPATRNFGNAMGNLPKNRTGGGFASRIGRGFVPRLGAQGGPRTVTSAQALEVTGPGAAPGGLHTVTSAQALEVTGK